MNVHTSINLKHSCVLRGAREGMGFYYLFNYYHTNEMRRYLLNNVTHKIKVSKRYKFPIDYLDKNYK